MKLILGGVYLSSLKKHRKLKIVSGAMTLLLVVIVATATYNLINKKEDSNKRIPITATINSENDSRYEILNGELKVTYNDGLQWHLVPASIDELFAGDYRGTEQALMEEDYSSLEQKLIQGSYIITPERTAFVIGEEVAGFNDYEAIDYKVLLSSDKGETWERTTVTNSPGVRVRFLGFTSEQNGYLIISFDRTMGFEGNAIYKTNDGGNSWWKAGSVEQTNRHVTSGSFINESLGFISFGSVRENSNPERPSIYRTIDGGQNWDEINLPIPVEYKGIFTVAEQPSFDVSNGTLLVNQGPNGDYEGGKVLARYISADEGASWTFANLVDPGN